MSDAERAEVVAPVTNGAPAAATDAPMDPPAPEPVEQEPAAGSSPAKEEPAVTEPAAQEPAAVSSPAKEPAVKESAAEDPAAQDPAAPETAPAAPEAEAPASQEVARGESGAAEDSAAQEPTAPETAPAASQQAVGNLAEGMTPEELTADVKSIKAVLDAAQTASKEDIHAGLARLRSLGCIPAKVLGATKIGVVVNDLSKSSAVDQDVRAAAHKLVEVWRTAHRKRKSSSNLDGSALKRNGSTASNLGEDSLMQPSESQGTDLARQDSLAMPEPESQEPSDAQKKIVQQRDKVRVKLAEALAIKEGEQEGADMEAEMADPAKLAEEIEEAMYTQLKGEASKDEMKAYNTYARTILFNLRDPKNPDFRFKLSVGFYKAVNVPKMNNDQMASQAKTAERMKIRKDACEASQSDWAVRNGGLNIGGTFTCGKCKGTKTTYFQMQTRSSDEPMTTFVTCLGCNNRWKFC